jgi:hypothetical protein
MFLNGYAGNDSSAGGSSGMMMSLSHSLWLDPRVWTSVDIPERTLASFLEVGPIAYSLNGIVCKNGMRGCQHMLHVIHQTVLLDKTCDTLTTVTTCPAATSNVWSM